MAAITGIRCDIMYSPGVERTLKREGKHDGHDRSRRLSGRTETSEKLAEKCDAGGW
jgi:hypothetical protein